MRFGAFIIVRATGIGATTLKNNRNKYDNFSIRKAKAVRTHVSAILIVLFL